MIHDPYYLLGIVFLVVGFFLFLVAWALGWWQDGKDPEWEERRKWYQGEINAVIYNLAVLDKWDYGHTYLALLLSEYRQEGV